LQSFLQNLIIGVQAGAVYALIAVGYTMVYGVLRLINFAHGDVYMVGAYVALTVATRMGKDAANNPIAGRPEAFALMFVLTVVVCALLGMVIERLAYRPLRSAPRLTALITAIGVSLLLESLAMLTFGTAPQFFGTLFQVRQIHLGGVDLNPKYLIILASSVVLMAALWYVVARTRIGRAMRAVSHDREAAALMGVNTNLVISATFGLGSALAGAAGLLVSAVTNVRIDPLVGVMPGLKAFVAAVLGGIGNIPGAVLGGLVMGISETFVSGGPYSTWRDAIAFVLLILILVFKPGGLLGRAGVEKV
jgi:branched-chain amino acid transport system permease protein